MGTRSMIAQITDNATIKSVYCHWDGYLEHNGHILNEFYQDRLRVAVLLEHGDLSSLGARFGEKHDFNESVNAEKWEDTRCTFYKRDRGEDGVDAREFGSANDLLEYFEESWCEFLYIQDFDGVWHVIDRHHNNDLVELSVALKKKQAA
jgi:hypothetical protein